jgi:tetratricopeptide (TPR) repeat protein
MNDETTRVDDRVAPKIKNAYDLFRCGKFVEAGNVLSEALAVDFDRDEVVSALKCANFWKERTAKLEKIHEDEKKSKYLFEQWDRFVDFVDRLKKVYEGGIYPIKQWVFGTALVHLKRQLEQRGKHDVELLVDIGHAHKRMGDYAHAAEFFEAANRQSTDDPGILAELADSYALINEVRAAKIFFREAFFLGPEKIDLKRLESLLICRLVAKVRDMGYESPDLERWLPVYGNLLGVLSIKRELKPLEFGKLRQAVYQVEKEYGEEGDQALVPKLINHYFWLIDHYIAAKAERNKIEGVLAQLKELDPIIYEKYVK